MRLSHSPESKNTTGKMDRRETNVFSLRTSVSVFSLVFCSAKGKGGRRVFKCTEFNIQWISRFPPPQSEMNGVLNGWRIHQISNDHSAAIAVIIRNVSANFSPRSPQQSLRCVGLTLMHFLSHLNCRPNRNVGKGLCGSGLFSTNGGTWREEGEEGETFISFCDKGRHQGNGWESSRREKTIGRKGREN